MKFRMSAPIKPAVERLSKPVASPARRPLHFKPKVYKNASKGLDMKKPVKKLYKALRRSRKSLSKVVTRIQKAHDVAKDNNRKSGVLLREEKHSAARIRAAKEVLKGQMAATKANRDLKNKHFPHLPEEVERIVKNHRA